VGCCVFWVCCWVVFLFGLGGCFFVGWGFVVGCLVSGGGLRVKMKWIWRAAKGATFFPTILRGRLRGGGDRGKRDVDEPGSCPEKEASGQSTFQREMSGCPRKAKPKTLSGALPGGGKRRGEQRLTFLLEPGK